jgi:hypothetical protein
MAVYSGRCEIAVADGDYAVANASLLDDGSGPWYGRITCPDVDWFATHQLGAAITIRLPNGRVSSVTVSRFTYLLPTQATVLGIGSRPW